MAEVKHGVDSITELGTLIETQERLSAEILQMLLRGLAGALAVFAGVAAGLGFGAYKEVMAAKPKRSLREAKATIRMLTERHS